MKFLNREISSITFAHDFQLGSVKRVNCGLRALRYFDHKIWNIVPFEIKSQRLLHNSLCNLHIFDLFHILNASDNNKNNINFLLKRHLSRVHRIPCPARNLERIDNKPITGLGRPADMITSWTVAS